MPSVTPTGQAQEPQSSLSPADKRYIICMKWGDKYGPEYVNRLYNMVSKTSL